MTRTLLILAVGFVSGMLSGMFGIGGGIITTPALRLLLAAPALIAVGTPLPVIIPSAITGSVTYARQGLADIRSGVTVGLFGSAFAVLGALLATRVGGQVVLIVTAALIVYMAVDMTLQAYGSRSSAGESPSQDASASPRPRFIGLVALGIMTGLYSGFLGLGGGFVLVPMLSRWFRFPIKRAVATSLVAVGILAVPGTITHYLLGNVDVRMALLLIVGVIPGALVGARITLRSSDRTIRVGFAALLLAVGLLLGASELGLF